MLISGGSNDKDEENVDYLNDDNDDADSPCFTVKLPSLFVVIAN